GVVDEPRGRASDLVDVSDIAVSCCHNGDDVDRTRAGDPTGMRGAESCSPHTLAEQLGSYRTPDDADRAEHACCAQIDSSDPWPTFSDRRLPSPCDRPISGPEPLSEFLAALSATSLAESAAPPAIGLQTPQPTLAGASVALAQRVCSPSNSGHATSSCVTR